MSVERRKTWGVGHYNIVYQSVCLQSKNMVPIVSSVLYLPGQKDLCSVMASIGKVLALVQEFFYHTQYVSCFL